MGQHLQNFPIPVHLTHPLRRFPLELGNGGGPKKIAGRPYQRVKKVICLFVYNIQ